MTNAISSGSKAPWLGAWTQNQFSALQARRNDVIPDITLLRDLAKTKTLFDKSRDTRFPARCLNAIAHRNSSLKLSANARTQRADNA
jgi:hypothetical protein